MVFKMCEGISCSSFSVKELDVIGREKYFPCITLLNFGHYVPRRTSEPGGISCIITYILYQLYHAFLRVHTLTCVYISVCVHIDGLARNCGSSSANTLEPVLTHWS